MSYLKHEPNPGRLVSIAISHYQFEAIHPFNDGNGRLGRLLIALTLNAWGFLDYPLLYLSEYFEERRSEYIQHLADVTGKGDWNGWIEFFLTAVDVQAKEATTQAKALLAYMDELRVRYRSGRSRVVMNLLEELFKTPVIRSNALSEQLQISKQSAANALSTLEHDGLLTEVTGKQRYRVYVSHPILEAVTRRGEPTRQ